MNKGTIISYQEKRNYKSDAWTILQGKRRAQEESK